MYIRAAAALLLLLAFSSMVAFQTPPNHLTDPFATGWMVVDTNGDGIADFVAGKIVVPAQPTAVENAAAADIAARVGFATTGLTPPVVVSTAEDRGDGPRIYVGGSAAPVKFRPEMEAIFKDLEEKEGGIFALGPNLVVLGKDNDGLLAAAEQFASRAPYVSKIGGDRLSTLGQIAGVTYLKGFAGVHRAFLESKEVKTLPAGAAIAASAPPPNGPEVADAEGAPARLDLATLYTMRGLFRGTQRMPIPSNLDSQLYVPEGAAGIAMANLAARMGLETTGITLPLATPATNATAREVRAKSVVAEVIRTRQGSRAEIASKRIRVARAGVQRARANCASSTKRSDGSRCAGAWRRNGGARAARGSFSESVGARQAISVGRRNSLRSAPVLFAAIVRRAGQRRAVPARQSGRRRLRTPVTWKRRSIVDVAEPGLKDLVAMRSADT